MRINREYFAWAAGLFEGEGSIGANPHFRTRYLRVASTDFDVISKFVAIVQLGKVFGPYQNGIGNKLIYRWQCGTFEHVQAIICLLWPWLHSRRRQRITELMRSACA